MDEELNQKNIVETTAELVTELSQVEVKTVEYEEIKAPFAVVPEGKKLQNLQPLLESYLGRPVRRDGVARLNDLGSFIAHANRFKGAQSALFAELPDIMRNERGVQCRPSIQCVFDYHAEGFDSDASYGAHKSEYGFEFSDEFLTWMGGSQNVFESQDAFAEFIEDNIGDVVVYEEGVSDKLDEYAAMIGCKFASPSRLMELSRGLAVHVNERVTQKVNINTGERELVYEADHNGEGGGKLEVPNAFLLAIPPFKNGAIYSVIVKLRYRVRNGGVRWSFELFRIRNVIESAFTEACARAHDETGLPIFQGKPETKGFESHNPFSR